MTTLDFIFLFYASSFEVLSIFVLLEEGKMNTCGSVNIKTPAAVGGVLG